MHRWNFPDKLTAPVAGPVQPGAGTGSCRDELVIPAVIGNALKKSQVQVLLRENLCQNFSKSFVAVRLMRPCIVF